MKNRVHSVEFRAEAARRLQAGESPAALAQELNVNRKLLYRWRDQIAAGKPLRVTGRPKKVAETEVPPGAAERIQQLEQLVGRLSLENRFFKGALQRIEQKRRADGESGATQSSNRSKR